MGSFISSSCKQYTFELIILFFGRRSKYTLLLKSHKTGSKIFLSWIHVFEVVWLGSLRLHHDHFRWTLLLTIYFSSPVIIRFKNGSFSACFSRLSQALMRCIRLISLSSYSTHISGLFVYPSCLRWFSTQDFEVLSLSNLACYLKPVGFQ